MKLSSILVLLLIFLTISSCKEELKPYCVEYPDECADILKVKDYFYFKEGSWWVYEEENSGEIDSVYVTFQVNNPDTYFFRTETFSTHNDYYFYYWSFGGIQDNGLVRKDENALLVKIAKTKPGDFVSESYCFIYYPTVGDKVSSYGGYPYNNDNDLVVEEFLDSYFQNFHFEEVVIMSEEHTASENSQPTRKYYAKGVGMIRKELLDSGQVWILKDYHISP